MIVALFGLLLVACSGALFSASLRQHRLRSRSSSRPRRAEHSRVAQGNLAGGCLSLGFGLWIGGEKLGVTLAVVGAIALVSIGATLLLSSMDDSPVDAK